MRSLLCALSGTLTGGTLVLAAGLTGVQIWATSIGQNGPGLITVLCHAGVAVLAVRLQMTADRRDDNVGSVALVGVLALVLGSLWFWWWS